MDRPEGYVPALGYRWLTWAYDPVVRWTTRERRFKTALLQQAGLASGMHVLDLACGTGTLAVMAAAATPGVTLEGVDGDAAILAQARRKAARAGANITFSSGLSTTLPYPEQTFDRVLSTLFFHHLSHADKVRTLQEIWRVLKPGGELHVADWGAPTSHGMRLLFYSIQFLDGFANTADNIAGRLPQLFREAGFEDVTITATMPTVYGTLALYRARKPSA